MKDKTCYIKRDINYDLSCFVAILPLVMVVVVVVVLFAGQQYAEVCSNLEVLEKTAYPVYS